MTTTIETIATRNVETVRMGTPVELALRHMKEKRIRHLPVIDHDDIIVGVLSQKDLTNIQYPQKLTVEQLMSSPIEFVDQNMPLRSAILRMLEKKISCLIVTNESDAVVGIVTTDDILWHLAHLLKDEKDENKSLISAMNLQFIGEVANKLSLMGI